MAIRQKKVIYVTDRGHEFVVSEMTATHLMNTIMHINNQIDMLADIPECLNDAQINVATGYLSARIDVLIESRNILALELCNRNPEKDEQYEEENCSDGRLW